VKAWFLKQSSTLPKEGGFWAEVPALPGCVTQGENRRRTSSPIYAKAVEGWLSVESGENDPWGPADRIVEFAV